MGKGADRQKKRAQEAKKAEKRREQRKSATGSQRFFPKHGQLPDKSVMDVIAESLHTAVTEVFDEIEKAGADTRPMTENAKIRGRCLYYAAAGQYIATTFLGRDYRVQVGSLGVTTADDLMLTIDAAQDGIANRRFHMWLGADDGGFIEFVDFTSRFFKGWADETGAKWEREDLPPYVWGSQKDIREKHGVFYKHEIAEEPEAEKLINANEKIIDAIVKRAQAIASKKLFG